MSESVLYNLQESVATITLNRPEQLNAYTREMGEALLAAIDRADADDQVRAIIFTGAGRAFCAGADLSAGSDSFTGKNLGAGSSLHNADGSINYTSEEARDHGGLVSLRLYQCRKPLIAAINGPAAGVGITMTLPMDFRLASNTAKAGFVFSRRAIVPEAASSFFLPRLVGISKALEWCYSGKLYDAQTLFDGGLFRSIHAPEHLMDAAHALAHELTNEGAPVSIALIRQMLWRGMEFNHPIEAHKIDSRAVLWRGQSNDVKEGVNAFLEKRAARFTDQVSKDMPDFYPWWDEPKYQ